ELIFQVVGKHGAIWGIFCFEIGGTEVSVLASDGTLLDIHERIPNREQCSLLLECLCTDMAQRTEIIENVEAPAEGGSDQIICLFLNRQIAHGDRRHSAFELRPMAAAVEREEEAKFGADEQQLRIDWIFGDGEHRAIRGKIAGN